jgi:flagellar protein FliO/FliZ
MSQSLATLVPMASFAWPAVALLGVLALILIIQRVVRLSGVYRQTTGRRLAVVEAMAIDPRRRLHLIRCDEHTVLLLTGGNQDLVVGWLREGRP